MEIVVMPKLGFNMDEGKLISWYKGEGDAISKGEPLFSIETDKTNIDVEAAQDGVVRRLLIDEGETVPVTLPIAIIAGADEDISAAEQEALAQLGGGTAVNGTVPEQSTPEAAAVHEPPRKAPVATPAEKAAGAGDYDYDVIVIGGGPGGYVAAIKAAQLGLHVALAERDRLGGVCLNRGCIPTKAFLRSAESLREVRAAADFGVKGVNASKAALDMKKVQARKADVVSRLVGGVESLLKKNKVDVLRGDADIADAHTVTVSGDSHSTASIIIATGSEIKGLPPGVVRQDDVLTSDTLLELESLPKDIVIIGGGVIGVEFAYFLAVAGVKVSIVEFLDRILPPVDAEIAELVSSDLERLGIDIRTGAKVTSVEGNAVTFEQGGKTESIGAERVLMAVGRAPRLTVDTDRLGISTERGAIVTDEHMRTSVPGIYAIGDVNGKVMLAHTASAEGIVAAENIAGRDVSMRYDAIPSAVYISPEAASVGLSEDDARGRYGDAVRVGRFPIAANGKSMVAGETSGLVKVIVDSKYGEILGAHLYCMHATDMIAEIATAIRAEATAEEVAAAVHPHPTVSEAVMEAFHAALGAAIHC
ncbi:MAG: dihydrolipoyl dehydrogenase [Clostridiales Family XIII bacterium]|jgi:dihydrolipoamide dehydrogenase|nr:dihydrolipoyl dehydrogenase [Clostridiales Family XIII bacterium]